MKPKLVIAIDFDGTIVENKWPEIGKRKMLAKTVIKWIAKRGHQIIIWTCREGEKEKDACIYLLNNKIPFIDINRNTAERIEKYKTESRKISADWYVDDLAGFIGWWSVPLIILWLEWKRRK